MPNLALACSRGPGHTPVGKQALELTSAISGCRIHTCSPRHCSTRPLEILGHALAEDRLSYELVAVGGGSLLLLGLISRATADLDVVAMIEAGRYIRPTTLPDPLREAALDAAGVLGIRPDWINLGPTGLLDFGLPEGFAERTVERRYGGLVVHLAGRRDQLFLKLYAATDQGPHSKHFQDLVALGPTPTELLEGARWTVTHDPSPGFRAELVGALRALGVEDADERL